MEILVPSVPGSCASSAVMASRDRWTGLATLAYSLQEPGIQVVYIGNIIGFI